MDSPQPLYLQVKQHIISNIGSGKWAASNRVPSESDLVRSFGVSRMTANRALRELKDEGVLVRIAGVGTFVADRTAQSHPLQVRNVADEIRARGRTYGAHVLSLERVSATIDLAQDFGMKAGASLFHSVIVHCENELPMQLEDRYVRPAAAPRYLKEDFTRGTPHEHLMRTAPLQEAQHVLRAVMPEALVRRRLQMKRGEPCLFVLRRTWTNSQVVSVARLFYPGSRYEMSGRFTP